MGLATHRLSESSPRDARRHAVDVAGLDADHGDVGGDRHSDCPGLVHQVTVSGDVSLHAPHLINIRSENSLPWLDIIMVEVGTVAPKGALYFLKKVETIRTCRS